MEILHIMKSIAMYFRRFTGLQNAIIVASFAVIASILTRNMWVCVWYILGLYLSFHLAKRLVGSSEYLHSEWSLKIISVVKIGKALIRTAEPTIAQEPKLTWEDLIRYSVPHAEAQTMIQFITRDFVKTWYHAISSDEVCPDGLQEVLELGCNDILARIQTVDKYKFLEWTIKFYKQHLQQYQKAANKLKQQPKYRKKKSDSNAEFTKLKDINAAFESLGAFHVAMKTEDAELAYLLMAITMALIVLLPNEANDCDVAVDVLSQIVTHNVLLPLINMMCEPYWIHKTIIRVVSNEELVRVDSVHESKFDPRDSQKRKADTVFYECKDAEFTPATEQQEHETLLEDDPPHCTAIIPSNFPEEKESTPSISSLDSSETDSISAMSKLWVPDSNISETSSLHSDQDVEDNQARFGRRFSPEGESHSQDESVVDSRSHTVTSSALRRQSTEDSLDEVEPDTSSLREGSISSVDSAERAASSSALPRETGNQRLFHHLVYLDNSEEDEKPRMPIQQSTKTTKHPANTRSMSLDAADLRIKHLQSPTHIFVDIAISSTETAEERGGSQYTLYLIEVGAYSRVLHPLFRVYIQLAVQRYL